MENPFETVELTKKVRVKRTFKLNDLFEFFPEESSNTIALKRKIAEKIKAKKPEIKDFDLFNVTQKFFNRYFYNLRYEDEKILDELISSFEEFEMFKTI